jgi:hypothetical protein
MCGTATPVSKVGGSRGGHVAAGSVSHRCRDLCASAERPGPKSSSTEGDACR